MTNRWIVLAAVMMGLSTLGCRGDGEQAAGESSRPAAVAVKEEAAGHSGDAGGKVREASPVQDYSAERYRLVNQKDEIVSILYNGAVVITKRVSSPVCAVRGYVHTGGIYEGRWLGGGLSHLLEHLVAGGSSQRRTEAQNRNLLQAIGNDSNAYTTADHTAYFINTTADHLEQAADLLTGWMLGALITPDEYKREYQVVQRELEKGKGEPMRQFAYMSATNRYLVSPARVPVIGYQEVIQGLSRDDVYDYYRMSYIPNNMVFAVAADLDPEVMLQAMRKYLADAPPGRAFTRDIPPEPPVMAPRTIVATFPKLGQATLELSFPTIQLQNPDLYALDLLSAVLSWGDSAILPEELRDRQHLVSAVSASSDTPGYVQGEFSFFMRLDPDKIEPATQAVMKLIEQIKNEGVSADRLQRAKTQMRVARVRSMQGAENIAASMATDFMSTGDPHFNDLYVQRIEKVTAEEVREAARKYFNNQKLLTAVMLPAEYAGAAGLPRAEELIRPATPASQQAKETSAAKVERDVLDNGTVLLLKRITTSPVVEVRMYALGGLTAEDAATNGTGNMTMNLLPRGTRSRTAQQIAEYFDSIGGDISTGCGNNSWYWSATFLKEDLAKALEVYADVVNNPSFPESELETMKQRVLAAIASQDADWTSQAFRYFKKVFYGPMDSPYQFTIIGTEEYVNRLTPGDLSKWYSDKVQKAPRVLAIFGDIDPADAKKLANEYLGTGPKLPAVEPNPLLKSAVSATQPAGEPSVDVLSVHVQKTAQPLAGVVIGYEADSVIGDPANFPIAVADTMTSGYTYPTGYLHEILRGRGLVYVVHAVNQPGRSEKYKGTFLVYAGCDPRNVNEVVDVILQNIARVQGSAQDMQPQWFDRSRQLINISDAMSNETAADQASTAALDELYGLGFAYHDQFAGRINAVTLDQVRQVAANRLKNCIVTISTPMPDEVKVQTGKRTYSSFPPVDLTPRGVQHDNAGDGGQ